MRETQVLVDFGIPSDLDLYQAVARGAEGIQEVQAAPAVVLDAFACGPKDKWGGMRAAHVVVERDGT